MFHKVVACCLVGTVSAVQAADKPAAKQKPGPGNGAFKRFDKNRDGMLSKDEIPQRLRRLTLRTDQNGDGMITRQELAAARPNSSPSAAPAEKPMQPEAAKNRKSEKKSADLDVNAALRRLDKDGDGKLSNAEVPEGIRRAFARLDSDGDGMLDKRELARLPRAGQPNAAFFGRLDRDGDGRLSKEEVPEALRERFDRLDANSDGVVSAQEWEMAMAYRNRAAGGPGRAAETPKQAFNNQDADADGRLTRSEAKGEFARRFDQLDANKDGKLDLREATSPPLSTP